MRRVILLVVPSLIIMTGSTFAFDSMRKGFVLGGGLGFSPVAKWSIDNTTFDESKPGVGINFVIGYAPDEFNMIGYEVNVVNYDSEAIVGGNKQQISQGFGGVTWYRYYGPIGKSFFTVAGLGVYVFDAEDEVANDLGLGLLGGVGYEFARHIQVGGYASYGKTSDPILDYSHFHLSILISAVAF